MKEKKFKLQLKSYLTTAAVVLAVSPSGNAVQYSNQNWSKKLILFVFGG